MKKILTMITLLMGVLVSNGQECDYKVNEVDEFTGNVTKYLNWKTVAENKYGGLHISLCYLEGTYMMVGYGGNIGCATSDSKIMIKLEDGEMITLMNFGDIDCGDVPPMLFDLSTEDKALLYKSPIAKIRLYGSESYTDITPIEKDYFIKNLHCVEK